MCCNPVWYNMFTTVRINQIGIWLGKKTFPGEFFRRNLNLGKSTGTNIPEF